MTINELLELGLYTDGGHHKQWCLQQLALELGAPLILWKEKYGEPEEGIAP